MPVVKAHALNELLLWIVTDKSDRISLANAIKEALKEAYGHGLEDKEAKKPSRSDDDQKDNP